jgi:MFS family permease
VVIPGVLGLLAFAALVWVETHIEEPMLALRLLEERMFRRLNIVAMLSYGSFVGLLFLMPLFLQSLLGMTAIESGLVLFPQAIGIMITTQVCGRLYHSIGPRRLIFWGLAAMSIVSLALLTVDFDTSFWVIGTILFARGLALGFVFVPINAAVYANIAPADTGRATAIFSALRQIAASLGVALIATVLVEATTQFSEGAAAARDASLDAFHFAFFVGSCMIMLAACAALMIRDRDAANTMQRYAELEPTPEEMIGLD